MKSIELYGHPVTTYYQVGLAMLGLCKQNYYISKSDIKTFAQAAMHDGLSYGQQFSVDTGAVAALALTCMQQESYQPANTIRNAAIKLLMKIFCAKDTQGIIGNIYSTGLAMQALIANDQLVPSEVWNRSNTLQEVLREIDAGAFTNAILASQILPPIQGKTYLDVDKLTCNWAVDTHVKSILQMDNLREITVTYTVIYGLLCSPSCSHYICLTVPKGTRLLQIMRLAQEKDQRFFRFTEKTTSLGPFITSIGGIDGSENDRTYWQFLNGSVPIPMGVAQYKPSNGENIIARLSKY
ncbi:transcobalamin-1-like [Cetorhinus maximus]